jgi:hypothetical protein
MLKILGVTDALKFADFLAIDPDKIVVADSEGDVTVTGIMMAQRIMADDVETKKLAITNDKENTTVGVAIVCPKGKMYVEEKCTDSDSEQGDGKSVTILTDVINENSTVFTSFESNPGASSWIEKEKENDDYVGFTIKLSDEVAEEVLVNWWIVEAR